MPFRGFLHQYRRKRILGKGVYQAVVQCVAGVDFFGGEKHLEGACFADEARQALCATPASDESEGGAAVSEEGVWSSDASLTCQRQVKPASHAITVDRGDSWSWEVRDNAHQPLSHLCETKCFRAVQLGNFVEVGADGEKVRIAGDHQSRQRSLRKFLEGGCQRKDPGTGETVGAVNGDEPQDR